jgi:hypothetical protein
MSCACLGKCGCCAGLAASVPEIIYNRPGLNEIDYRIGEHGAIFESMLTRLSSSDFPALAGLTARTTEDPSIGLLDAWAVVEDVLTFYQERIANEGYLRTATERRSVQELARLIGYQPRPGVAASVYLAYTVDSNATEPVEIPKGARVQSVPAPGEMPQSFETSDTFIARKEWNAMRPRLRRPQTAEGILEGTDEQPGAGIFLKGISLQLKPNDALLLSAGSTRPVPYRILTVEENAAQDYTFVTFTGWLMSGPLPARPVTQLRRALKSMQSAGAELGDPTSIAAATLEAGTIFLDWFYSEALLDSRLPEVNAVLNNADVLDRFLKTFSLLRAAALSTASDPQLARAAERIAKLLDGLKGQAEEVSGLEDGGAFGPQLDAAATVLETIGGSDPEGTAETRADRIFIAKSRNVIRQLARTPSVPPRNSDSLVRSARDQFDAQSAIGARLTAALQPRVADGLHEATRNLIAAGENPIRVFVLRQRALLFGATAPKKIKSVNANSGVAEMVEWTDTDIVAAEETGAVHLDGSYEKAKSGSWVMIDYSGLRNAPLGKIRVNGGFMVVKAGEVDAKVARSEYNFSGQTTRVELSTDSGNASWFTVSGSTGDGAAAFCLIRRTAVHFVSEELTLAEQVITSPVCGGDDWIEIDGLAPGLESGRWLLISGERADIAATSGVASSELVMLESARQYVEKVSHGKGSANDDSKLTTGSVEDKDTTASFLPGDKVHTYLKLAQPLRYCFKRDTIAINANVVNATHGETRQETLGAGDSSQSLQQFALKQPPLTFVASPQPAGAESTLRVYVNNVQWHEAPALLDLQPESRGFTTRTGDDGVTVLTFGNGVTGARLPTGLENVKAMYRTGIGAAGNVKAGQISQLMTRPLGVKSVNNPIGASGGADRESRDDARRNAPLAVQSLGRLVSTQDYADFARTFAGIGKAVSSRLASQGVETIFLTLAGAGDIPIDTSSDLYANLVIALRDYGDPYQSFRVDVRELLFLVLGARLAPHPDYIWEDVVTRVRAALLDHFSFERRDLGESLALSQVIATIQSVRGVLWVDIDALGAVSQLASDGGYRAPQEIAAAANKVFEDAAAQGRPNPTVVVRGIRLDQGKVLPAQLAFFVPAVPETIILNRVEPTMGEA